MVLKHIAPGSRDFAAALNRHVSLRRFVVVVFVIIIRCEFNSRCPGIPHGLQLSVIVVYLYSCDDRISCGGCNRSCNGGKHGLWSTRGRCTRHLVGFRFDHARITVGTKDGCRFGECRGQDIQDFQRSLAAVRDGAKSIAVCAAAWESIRQGGVVRVRSDF